MAFINKVYKPTTLNSGVFVIRPNRNDYEPAYLYHVLMSKHFEDFLNKLTAGSTISHLYQKDFVHYNFPTPPTLTEQKAIATALNDVDELITKLEKLIAKKKAIKQGAMQHLLRPDDDWITKSLVELAENKKELFDDGDWIESEHITTNGIRLIQTGNIGVGQFRDRESKKYIYAESFQKLNCKLLQEGDLLICRLADPAGRACILPNIGEKQVITSVDVTIFRPRPTIANRVFLSYIFSTPNWFKQITEKVGGTTHKRISRGALGRIKIQLPPIEKQQEIALILSDMDNEIFSLKSKRDKSQGIKQGMMQELLTGKTRLI